MKALQNFRLHVAIAFLFLAFSASSLFAGCTAPEQHAGYQGIPGRNAANCVVGDSVATAHAYSGLPHRMEQAEIDVRQSEFIAAYQDSKQIARSHAGYSGIPQSANSENRASSDDVAERLSAGGYRGIPQSAEPGNDGLAITAAALVRPK